MEVIVMHRTQIIFEERHYSLLKTLAEKESKSISQVLREMVDSYTQKTGVFSINQIEGIAEDTSAYGEDHDKWLYGKQ
jgi:predicted DNA-binding ribbon-helix-helix protein